MSGITNPAFEEIELNGVETCRRTTPTINRQDTLTNGIARAYNGFTGFVSKNKKTLKLFGTIIFNALVAVYFYFAVVYWLSGESCTRHDCDLEWCNGFGMLLILLILIYGGIFYFQVIKRYVFQLLIRPCCQPLSRIVKNIKSSTYGSIISQIVIYTVIFLAIIVFLVVDTAGQWEKLRSALAVVILLLFGFVFSKHPGQINWRPVFSGLIIQFIFGLITIRWAVGRSIFQCLSGKIASFLDFAKTGAGFIFSEEIVAKGVFAFAVLPVIFYFSFLISVLYYLGAMQWVILKLGSTLQALMGTTICESVNGAANIFIGMTEAPLLIKPYVRRLTASELHTVMCSGFASVSGTVLAAYIGFGANPAHLITASVMAAPASLCFSKLFYPEVEKSLTSSNNIQLEKSQDSGLIDAATKGAVAGIPMVLGIIANIVAFVSFIALANSILSWLGLLVGIEDLTVELILSRVFMPLAWIIGVPWEMCEDVGTLIGLKTVVNEFVAYQKLGEYKRAGKLYGRAEAIATFAICGFSNPGSIGIMISMLSSIAPEKREIVTSVVMRAFVAGAIVCFLTASIAGMLTDDNFFENNASAIATATRSLINSTVLS